MNLLRFDWTLALAAAWLAAFALYPLDAQANGRVASFERKMAGPYEIAFATIPPSPSVGSLHLALTVSDGASGEPRLGADVSVQGAGPGSTEIEIGPTAAASSAIEPTYYEVNTSVDREGAWRFTATVTDDQGSHSADFLVEVKNVNPLVGMLTLAALLAFLVVFGLALRASLEGRRRRRENTSP